MRHSSPEYPHFRCSTAFENLRVTLEPESLVVESRDAAVGSWTPAHQIYWVEVNGLFIWKTTTPLLIILGALLAMLGFVVAAVARSFGVLEGAVVAFGIFCLALGIRFKPTYVIRIESSQPRCEIRTVRKEHADLVVSYLQRTRSTIPSSGAVP